jgi:hypothetical protein
MRQEGLAVLAEIFAEQGGIQLRMTGADGPYRFGDLEFKYFLSFLPSLPPP